MITTAGKNVIKRVFGGQLSRIANILVVGSGSYDAAPALTDTGLTRESYRANITSISADLANNKIVFKAKLPAGAVRQMGEVGLIQGDATSFKSLDLSLFNNGSSAWSNSSGTSSANARNYLNDPVFTVATNSTLNPVIANLALDLSAYSDLANLFVSYTPTTTNLQAFKIRFISTTGNYFEYTITPVSTAGSYAVAKLQKSAATVTGSPSWASITSVQLILTSKTAGAVDVHLDGVRFESPVDTSSVLVARNVLVAPVTIDSAIDTEIEYSLVISV